jgi:hypothetical protein
LERTQTVRTMIKIRIIQKTATTALDPHPWSWITSRLLWFFWKSFVEPFHPHLLRNSSGTCQISDYREQSCCLNQAEAVRSNKTRKRVATSGKRRISLCLIRLLERWRCAATSSQTFQPGMLDHESSSPGGNARLGWFGGKQRS